MFANRAYFFTQAFVASSHFMSFIFSHSALVFGASAANAGAVTANRSPATIAVNRIRQIGRDQGTRRSCARSGSMAALDPKMVLVVKDEPLVRMVAAKILAEAGYLILEARTGDEAIQILTAGAP